MRRPTGEKHVNEARGFTLVEVIISLVILSLGVISLLRLFPIGVQVSVMAERSTKAALLAEEIIESIKSMGGGGMVRVIPGSLELVPVPGDGLDTDGDANPRLLGDEFGIVDANMNGRIDSDMDGMIEKDFQYDFTNGIQPPLDHIDSDVDGIVDDTGDSGMGARAGKVWSASHDLQLQVGRPDGDTSYDPEFVLEQGYRYGADEEYPDGLDNDEDGLIDEDCRLASDWCINERWHFPLRPGNGVDDDGDGEEGSPVDGRGRRIADGVDNNEDGRIDEGVDEETFDGYDNDRDGQIDEDCRASSYPFTPRKFPGLDVGIIQSLVARGIPFTAPDGPQWPWRSSRFAWQIQVSRVPDGGGDFMDNDGDGRIDEEIRDGLDNDGDDLIDEDCIAAPVPGFRCITVLIAWDGDEDQSLDGFPGERGDDDGDGGSDFNDPEIRAGMEYDAVDMLGYPSLDSVPDSVMRFLEERWAMDDDEDGRIDEEKKDGLDNDNDGLIDEDCYGSSYSVSTILQI